MIEEDWSERMDHIKTARAALSNWAPLRRALLSLRNSRTARMVLLGPEGCHGGHAKEDDALATTTQRSAAPQCEWRARVFVKSVGADKARPPNIG